MIQFEDYLRLGRYLYLRGCVETLLTLYQRAKTHH